MIKSLHPKKAWGVLGISFLAITALFVGIRIVSGQSISDLLGRSYAVGAGDDRPVAWVGDEYISLGQFIGLKEVLINVEKVPPEQANQDALNRLVRIKIIQLLAKEMGLTPKPMEVEDRLALLYEQATQTPEILAILEPQAKVRGMDWESEAFKDLLRESLIHALEAEHLYQKVLEQADGDSSIALSRVADLIVERYSSLDIRLEVSNLPEDALNIHPPNIDDLNASQFFQDEIP